MTAPWFPAAFDGDCSNCSAPFDEGDQIRADADGGWMATCCEDVDET